MKLVSDHIQEMVSRRLETYHGNRVCWVFTASRWGRIRSLLPKTDVKDNLHVPLELVFAELNMDFSKKRMWRRMKVRSLLAVEPYFGFLEDNCRLRLIKPITKDAMLAWPLSKADEIRQYMLKVIGLGEFVDYLADTDEGKKLLTDARQRIKQLSKRN